MKVARSADRQDSDLVDLARSTVADVFPNPERTDCPDRTLREDLAFRRKDLKRHWDVLEHICTCSPCFAEHMAFRKRVRRRSTYIRLGGAFFGLCAALALWSQFYQPAERLTIAELRKAILPLPGMPEITTRTSTVAARLDFSNWSVTRTPVAETPSLRPPLLARGRLSLTIQLPMLSSPGMYRVVLSSGQGSSLIQRNVRATVVGGATILEPMEVDTTAAPAGTYRLTVLREGASAPREFPVRIE